MYSEYKTVEKNYLLATDKFICNKFGLAEFFSDNYFKFKKRKELNVLDCGCGALPLGIFLADQHGCKVIAVELNPLACECAKQNIEKYRLETFIQIKNINFINFMKTYTGQNFDLIVANPPLDDNVAKEKILKFSKESFSVIDEEKFTFLTNSWHSEDNKDLLDYIFEFGITHLTNDGSILIVFCMIDCSSPNYVYDKSSKYGYEIIKSINDYVTAESIGVKILGIDKFSTYMVEFRRKRHVYFNKKCIC